MHYIIGNYDICLNNYRPTPYRPMTVFLQTLMGDDCCLYVVKLSEPIIASRF